MFFFSNWTRDSTNVLTRATCMCTTMLLQLVAQLDLQVFPFFCLITELLLSLANHAKVVTESVLFQKISTSHRKRCQNEQEGKDYFKVKCIFKFVMWTSL